MITFSKLGKHGRLGNQLFQIAAVIGLAKKHGQQYGFPHWHYAKYFKGNFENFRHTHIVNLAEPHYHYWPEIHDHIKSNKPTDTLDLFGYFQSEKYFENCKEEILNQFTFKGAFEEQVIEKYAPCFKHKEIIAVSIRRGDYVGNKNYAQLPITWYYNALEDHFPDWRNMCVIIFSDDVEYCKLHFGNYENVVYADNKFNNNDRSKYFDENRSAMEQLCLMTLCDHFIIANSTFSWWGAWLGEKSNSIVVRPSELFAGNMAKNNSIKDHYPAEWISYAGRKIDLTDVTFTIPVAFDHTDRLENMSLNVCMLQKYFDTNIIVGEQFSDRFRQYADYGCKYKKFNYSEFHRTRMLNVMAKEATTPIIVNWDADVFISPLQMLQAVEAIRNGADMVFPYDGRFARVPRIPYFKSLEKSLDVGIFGNTQFKGMYHADAKSVGGAIFFNKKSFFEGGGENQNFVSYGPEDVERDARFRRLNYNVQRINGALYHLDHWRGVNSKSHNKFYDQNHNELDKIYSLPAPEGLREYVNTWNWL